jgi:hypothetical protein
MRKTFSGGSAIRLNLMQGENSPALILEKFLADITDLFMNPLAYRVAAILITACIPLSPGQDQWS